MFVCCFSVFTRSHHCLELLIYKINAVFEQYPAARCVPRNRCRLIAVRQEFSARMVRMAANQLMDVVCGGGWRTSRSFKKFRAKILKFCRWLCCLSTWRNCQTRRCNARCRRCEKLFKFSKFWRIIQVMKLLGKYCLQMNTKKFRSFSLENVNFPINFSDLYIYCYYFDFILKSLRFSYFPFFLVITPPFYSFHFFAAYSIRLIVRWSRGSKSAGGERGANESVNQSKKEMAK